MLMNLHCDGGPLQKQSCSFSLFCTCGKEAWNPITAIQIKAGPLATGERCRHLHRSWWLIYSPRQPWLTEFVMDHLGSIRQNECYHVSHTYCVFPSNGSILLTAGAREAYQYRCQYRCFNYPPVRVGVLNDVPASVKKHVTLPQTPRTTQSLLM